MPGRQIQLLHDGFEMQDWLKAGPTNRLFSYLQFLVLVGAFVNVHAAWKRSMPGCKTVYSINYERHWMVAVGLDISWKVQGWWCSSRRSFEFGRSFWQHFVI
uniref:Uncharacterized protein n=1 Tax=Chlamydomonas leiostraca TaxID=1034604 RepID=A0A7S0RPL6_9CHLO